MFKILNFIKDIISPKYCYSCKKEWHFLCQQCLQKLEVFYPCCYLCKQKNNNFEVHNNCKKIVYYDKIIVLKHYKNVIIKKLIKDSKFYWKKDILDDFWQYLSKILFENEEITNLNDFLIISSPMYSVRKLIRWYNHSEILSKVVSCYTWIKYNFNIIKKSRHTRQQSKLSKKERELNLYGVFEFIAKNKEEINWKTIVIVDDVISTWTTINELSKVLKENWAKKVIWLVIASD